MDEWRSEGEQNSIGEGADRPAQNSVTTVPFTGKRLPGPIRAFMILERQGHWTRITHAFLDETPDVEFVADCIRRIALAENYDPDCPHPLFFSGHVVIVDLGQSFEDMAAVGRRATVLKTRLIGMKVLSGRLEDGAEALALPVANTLVAGAV